MINLLLMCISIFNIFPSSAQSFYKYDNDDVIGLKAYKEGNIYQKDLLLMLDLLESTHPAFYSESIAPFDIEDAKKNGYEFGKSCNSIMQFRKYLQSVLIQLNDGHTTLLPIVDNSLIYPFVLFIDNNKVYLRGIDKEHESFLGKEIIQVNGQPVFDVINSFRSSISCDNDIYFYDKVDELMQLYSMWQENSYCLPDSTLQFRFSEEEMMTLYPILKKEINMVALPNNLMSSIRKNSKLPFLYEILSEKSICYLQFNACIDQSSLRAQYDMIKVRNGISEEALEKKLSQIPRFDEFISAMFEEIRHEDIQTLVIDVRNNSGGNSKLGDVLLSWLKPYGEIKKFSSSVRFSKLWEDTYPAVINEYKRIFSENKQTFELGKLYDSTFLSLINNSSPIFEDEKKSFQLNEDMNLIFKGNIIFIQNSGTYSSAGLLVSTVVDNNIGLVIGTESSYKPCNYGEILCWELPNTNIKGAISSKIFSRPDVTKCTEMTLSPTVYLRSSWEDILKNKDICWEWILSHY